MRVGGVRSRRRAGPRVDGRPRLNAEKTAATLLEGMGKQPGAVQSSRQQPRGSGEAGPGGGRAVAAGASSAGVT